MGNAMGGGGDVPEDDFPLLQCLPMDVLLKLFSFLDSKSLLAVLLTCHQSREAVHAFVSHQVLARDRLNRLRHFLQQGPLLLPEVALRRKLDSLGPAMESSLICLKAVRQLSDLRRVRVSDASSFPHLENGRYLYLEEDFELQRQVVRLNMVCWLNFVVDFDHVAKGEYEMSLRLRLTPHLNWPSYPVAGNNNGNVAVLSVSQTDTASTKKVLVAESFKPSWWKLMRERRFSADEHLKHASLRFEGGKGWMWVILESFRVDEDDVSLNFEFRDIDNPHWKNGMDWDFVQLRKIQ